MWLLMYILNNYKYKSLIKWRYTAKTCGLVASFFNCDAVIYLSQSWGSQ